MSKGSMKILCEVPIMDKALTELDISGKSLGYEGALVVAEYLRDNGAILFVNVLGNSIGVEQAQELIKILQAKDKLTTLCGFSGDETELNLSNKNLSAGCAVLIANEISDMGTMTSLNLSSSDLGGRGAKHVAKAIKVSN
jgi:Ran GTPase-activating protein (RanGAP) involved in mRNA processing and transport